MSVFRWLSWLIWFAAIPVMGASCLGLVSPTVGWIAFAFACFPHIGYWLYQEYQQRVVLPRLSTRIDEGTEYYEAGDFEKAEAIYREVAEIPSPVQHYAAGFLGVVLHDTLRFEEARSYLEQTVEDVRDGLLVGWDLNQTLHYRADNRVQHHDFEEAVDDLNEAIAAGWDEPSALSLRAEARSMLGHYRAAVEDLDEADCRSPGDVRTCLLFAGLLASCPIDELRDGQAAVEYARRACVELEWSDWYSVAILANAYAEAGNWREALRFAREARRLAPEDQQQERDERIRQFEARRPFRLPVEPDEPLPEEEPA